VYFIYSLLMGFAALLASAVLVFRASATASTSRSWRASRTFLPSLAKLPAERSGAIWLHAVSVGETLSSVTLARRLKEAIQTASRRFYDDHHR